MPNFCPQRRSGSAVRLDEQRERLAKVRTRESPPQWLPDVPDLGPVRNASSWIRSSTKATTTHGAAARRGKIADPVGLSRIFRKPSQYEEQREQISKEKGEYHDSGGGPSDDKELQEDDKGLVT